MARSRASAATPDGEAERCARHLRIIQKALYRPGGTPWGTWRHVNAYQTTFFGDRMPLVRCFHHQRAADQSGDDGVLNLTLAGDIYRSGTSWENTTGTVAVTLRRAAAEFQAEPQRFLHHDQPGCFESHLEDWVNVPGIASLRPTLHALAQQFMAHADARSLDPISAYRIATRLYLAAGEYVAAETAARRLLMLPGDHIEKEYILLADAYLGLHQAGKAVSIYCDCMTRNPDSAFLLDSSDKIVFRSVGFEPDGLHAALKQLGVE